MEHPTAAKKLSSDFYTWWDEEGLSLCEGDPNGDRLHIASLAWHAAVEASMEVAMDMIKKEFDIDEPNES